MINTELEWPASEWLVANTSLVNGIPHYGWHLRDHGALHVEKVSFMDETLARGPQGRTKDL